MASETVKALDALARELTEWRDAGGPVGEVAVRILGLIDTRILAHAKGFEPETNCERPEHATARLVTQAQTPRSDINIPCSCGPGDCNKRILAHNEYCTEDRRAFEVEEDLLLDRRVYGTSFHKIVDGKKVRVHPQEVRYIKGEPRDSSNTACTAEKTGEKP